MLECWKRPWCWERLKAGGEGDNRGWDGWMALPTWWTWVWVDSGSWWWTGRPSVLRYMGLQRFRHDWVTELKSPTYKPSSCELSEMQACIPCPIIQVGRRVWCALSCVGSPSRGWASVYFTVQSAVAQCLYFKPRMSRSKQKSSSGVAGTSVLSKVLSSKIQSILLLVFVGF